MNHILLVKKLRMFQESLLLLIISMYINLRNLASAKAATVLFFFLSFFFLLAPSLGSIQLQFFLIIKKKTGNDPLYPQCLTRFTLGSKVCSTAATCVPERQRCSTRSRCSCVCVNSRADNHSALSGKLTE